MWSVVPGGTPVLLALGKSEGEDEGGGGCGAVGGAGGAGREGELEPAPGVAAEPGPDEGFFDDVAPPRLLVYAMARVRIVTRLCAETRNTSTA